MSNSNVIKAQTDHTKKSSDLISTNKDSTNRESLLSEEPSVYDFEN